MNLTREIHISRLILLLIFFPVTVFSQAGGEAASITIEQLGDAHPYSHLSVNNNPENFQFAIVTDRTGGHRPGVFLDAVKKLNLLQPEFVVSIGDLIEGYTRDEERIYREWDEFTGFIDQLEMPFFYVPGNHDYINDVMARIWKEKFGPSYYHFIYKDVLFLCLNSEEATKGAKLGGIEKPQYDYVKKILDENTDVKWTLVFLHQPLWLYDNTRYWGDVEELLKDRDYTVFAGHLHHYVKHVRNDSKYFILATTGGFSRLRGANFGEFDHVAWVTMTDQGPIIANLLLEGIWHEDVVTEELMNMITKERIQIEPVFFDETFKEADFEIRISNDENYPMETVLRFGQHMQLIPEIVEYQKLIPPNSMEILNVPVHVLRSARADEIDALPLFAWFNYRYEDGREIKLDARYGIAPVQRLWLEKIKPVVIVDGILNEWIGFPQKGNVHSPFTGNKVAYDGDYDASFEFNTVYDDSCLYIGLSVWDDDLVTDRNLSLWQRDVVELSMDPRPLEISSNCRSVATSGDFIHFAFGPARSRRREIQFVQPELLPEGSLIKTNKTLSGFDAEIAIPLTHIKSRNNDDWETVRLNIAYQDKDGDDPKYEIWWMPEWSSNQNYIGSGTFFRRR